MVTVKSLVREHKPAVIRFYLDYRAVPKGNPMTADKRDSRTHGRYLYTTDPSLSEEVEEAFRVGDRGTPRDVKALGLEDSSFWRRERLQGYLTIFTINNVVRELIGS